MYNIKLVESPGEKRKDRKHSSNADETNNILSSVSFLAKDC